MKFPRPGGASLLAAADQAGGSCQEISCRCSAALRSFASARRGISSGGSAPQISIPERSINPTAFIRSCSSGKDKRSLIVCEHITTPTPHCRFNRVSELVRSTIPRPAISARHSSSSTIR